MNERAWFWGALALLIAAQMGAALVFILMNTD